jgi:concanavalin A-like lectin/glucanase superfamily protein/Big-like domain-containing protein
MSPGYDSRRTFTSLAFAVGVTIALSSSSTRAQSTAGLPDDGLSHPPPALGTFAYNSFVPPASAGASYVDPVFGSTVLRVTTDHSVDDIYARNMWWNADETRYLHRNPNGTAHADFLAVINVATGAVTHNGIPIGTLPGDEGFDPIDPDVLYYHSGSAIHRVALHPDGTWSDAVYFTAPNGAALAGLGGTINWLDASGRYMVVRYGPEPSVHLYDRQNMIAGPYTNGVDGATTINKGSYVGITPDGKFLVGYQGADGSAGLYHMGQGVSWRIDHASRSVAAAPTVFWSLCGDHGTFMSPSDGRDYMIVSNCNNFAELWRVDITNSVTGLNEAGQKALQNNLRLMAWPTWNEDGSHVSTVARGPLRDWTFYATEDGSDLLNGGTVDPGTGNITPWHAYRQEIVAFNVLTGETRRLAHHRSRSVNADYYSTPRVSASWGGKYVGWASNFNRSGVVDVYATRFGASVDTTPPHVAIAAPAAGATITGATTVSATASDNVGVGSVQFQIDGSNFGPQLVKAPYALSWTPTASFNGPHTLRAVASDAAGNSSTSAGVSIIVNIDTTPPVISGVAVSGVTGSAATISWTTDEPATSQVEYGSTTKYGGSTLAIAALVTRHGGALSGLTPGSVYHYRLESRDAAGNLAVSADFTFTTATPPLTASNPATGRLAAYWTFDEGSGTAAFDSSGASHTGMLVNGPRWAAGRIGGAIAFDGVRNYVTTANTATLNALPLTISAWIKTAATRGIGGIVNKYVAGSLNGYNLFMNNGVLCAWYFRDRADFVFDGSGCTLAAAGYNDNRWHLVTFVVDAAGGRLWVDGALKASRGWTGRAAPATSAQAVQIGRYPQAAGGFFAGVIDDVRIYTSALNPADVAGIGNGVIPR